jgi:hypothetical protein
MGIQKMSSASPDMASDSLRLHSFRLTSKTIPGSPPERIEGELSKLGVTISHETVGNILERHGIPPCSISALGGQKGRCKNSMAPTFSH